MRIGVIGTNATISSGAYEKAIRKTNPRIRVYSSKCPLFVPLVEEGWTVGAVPRRIASIYLKGLKAAGVDTLVLGCTHYPLLKNVIRSVMGPSVHLVDSSTEVAKEARTLLDASGILNKSAGKKTDRFFVSDQPENFVRMAERFLKRRLSSVKKV
jgi:glutamate racemase